MAYKVSDYLRLKCNRDPPSTVPIEHPINMLHSIDVVWRQEESRHEKHLVISHFLMSMYHTPLHPIPDSIFPATLPIPIHQIQPSRLQMYSAASYPGRAYMLDV